MLEKVKFDGEYKNNVCAKQLFLYDRKKKEKMWLVCAAHFTDVDLKKLNQYLPCTSGSLRGADAESLAKYLGSRQGTCNYFSMINDKDKKVKILLDQALLDAEYASFHPMDNAASTAINKEGMMKLKELAGRDDETFEIIDFVKLNGAPAGENAGGG